MAHHYEKDTGDLIIDGFQNGISGSPHAGIADMKNMNINSFPGEASVNYTRVNTLPRVAGGTFTQVSSTNVSYNGTSLIVGSAVIVGAGITGLSAGRYWIIAVPGGSPTQYNLSASYNGAAVSGMSGGGTATFSTQNLNIPVWKAKEYVQSRNQYRYYIVDNTSQVWVNDPNVYGVFSPAGSPAAVSTTNCQGIGVSQGVVNVFVENMIYQRYTNRIGDDTLASVPWSSYTISSGAYLNTPVGSTASHRAITSQTSNGALFWPDSQFIGSVRGSNPQFSLILGSTPGGTDTIATSAVEQGVLPFYSQPNLSVTVYARQGSTVPTGLTEGTQYYIVEVASNGGTFKLSATQDGSTITIGAGLFYVTTFAPNLPFSDADSSGTFIFSRQALRLPYYEQGTALSEISVNGTVNLVIGGISSYVYFWDESSSGYQTVRIPESGTARIINVANSAYVLPGNKGNIYITNATGVAGTMTVPDYCANPLGINQDPYFSWGDAEQIRGRVFFSIQDQNSFNTTGNCGGVWSFTPSQNLPLETNIEGLGLHLEGQNSYGTYNGVSNLIIPNEVQQVNGPQYWTAWTSSTSSPTYGIDYSGTTPYSGGQALIDTDIVSIGTSLDKGTPVNFEYKTSRPLVSGESVQLLARANLTSAFSLVGIGQNNGLGICTTVGTLSDLFKSNVQNLQWIQFRLITTSTASTPSFVPLTELRIRVGK